MPKYATDYEILRNVEANGRKAITLTRAPIRVVSLLDEQKFLAENGLMRHNDTVFFEDKNHDWHMKNDQFYYFTRIAQYSDVVLVFAEEDRT